MDFEKNVNKADRKDMSTCGWWQAIVKVRLHYLAVYGIFIPFVLRQNETYRWRMLQVLGLRLCRRIIVIYSFAFPSRPTNVIFLYTRVGIYINHGGVALQFSSERLEIRVDPFYGKCGYISSAKRHWG